MLPTTYQLLRSKYVVYIEFSFLLLLLFGLFFPACPNFRRARDAREDPESHECDRRQFHPGPQCPEAAAAAIQEPMKFHGCADGMNPQPLMLWEKKLIQKTRKISRFELRLVNNE